METNFGDLLKLQEIEKIKEILLQRGYDQQYISDKDNPKLLDCKFTKNISMVIIALNLDEAITINVIANCKKDYKFKTGELEELNSICDIISNIVCDYGYVMDDDKNTLYKSLKIKVVGTDKFDYDKSYGCYGYIELLTKILYKCDDKEDYGLIGIITIDSVEVGKYINFSNENGDEFFIKYYIESEDKEDDTWTAGYQLFAMKNSKNELVDFGIETAHYLDDGDIVEN